MFSRFTSKLLRRLLAVSLATCLLSVSGTLRASEQWPSVGVHSSSYVRIRHVLMEETVMEFIETPLDQVVDFLKDLHDIPIGLDTVAMDDVGLGTDTPVTVNLKGISLRSALQILLNPLEMTYTIENEILMLTTRDMAAQRPEIRIYNVSRLIGDDGDATNLAMTLVQALHATGPPVVGGGGFFDVQDDRVPGTGQGGMAIRGIGLRIIPFRRLLIVRHTTVGQDEVARLLADLAAALQEGTDQRPARAKRSKEDPFGSGPQQDPFGGGGSQEDPFGGPAPQEDPFGGPASQEDPFG
jgi:hypothetical protein